MGFGSSVVSRGVRFQTVYTNKLISDNDLRGFKLNILFSFIHAFVSLYFFFHSFVRMIVKFVRKIIEIRVNDATTFFQREILSYRVDESIQNCIIAVVKCSNRVLKKISYDV